MFRRLPGNELEYMQQAIKNKKICGDGEFTKKCSHWMEEKFQANHVLLTTSCTHALEMAAAFNPGGNRGMRSFFPPTPLSPQRMPSSSAGATLVFVDIRPDTMNLDERLIEDAITDKTKVIVPVHYAGVGCAMDEIMEIAARHHLMVVEDAAQGIYAYYKGRALGHHR